MWVRVVFAGIFLLSPAQAGHNEPQLVAAVEQQGMLIASANAPDCIVPYQSLAMPAPGVGRQQSSQARVVTPVYLNPSTAAADQPIHLRGAAALGAASKTSRPSDARKLPPSLWNLAKLRIDQARGETHGLTMFSREAPELSSPIIPFKPRWLPSRQNLELKGSAGA